MKKQTPEALVLAACRQVLQARGVAFWRINTGATKTADRFIRYGSVGFSDIVACVGGRFTAIESAGGATDQEVTAATGIPGDSVRPRRGELLDRGMIVDSGKRRKTTSGRMATVWEVVK